MEEGNQAPGGGAAADGAGAGRGGPAGGAGRGGPAGGAGRGGAGGRGGGAGGRGAGAGGGPAGDGAQPGGGGKTVKRKVTVPPEFKGTESAQRWFARFELCSRCNEWDEATMYNQVLPLMSGDALDLILDKDPEEIPDYRSVKEMLIKEYDNSELREQYVRDFKCRKLGEGEDYSAFMRALKVLAKKAYPDFENDPRNALVADRYREEMPEKVRAVLSLLSIESQDLDQLVSETRRLSKATDVRKSGLSVGAVSGNVDSGAVGGVGNDAILAKLTEMEDHMSQLRLAQSDMEVRVNGLFSRPQSSGRSQRSSNNTPGMRSRTFGGTCWGCGERGHLRKDCPSARKDQNPAKFYPNIICNKCHNPGHYSHQCMSGNA